MFGVAMIVYIDYVLLAVLLFLTFFTCGYCFYRVYILQQHGQVEVLLKPTKVLFSHKKEGIGTEELRTVVAYQNPFTGDYCVRKSRVPRGHMNVLPAGAWPTSARSARSSPVSGLSAGYEPLQLDPREPPPDTPDGLFDDLRLADEHKTEASTKSQISSTYGDNSVTKTWNWNYKEYQI